MRYVLLSQARIAQEADGRFRSTCHHGLQKWSANQTLLVSLILRYCGAISSESPKCRTFPEVISSLTVPATSSIGTFVSTRCWYKISIRSVRSLLSASSATSRMRSGRLSWPFVEFSILEAKLGGDHEMVAHRLQRLAQKLLICEWPVCFGGDRKPAHDRHPVGREPSTVACRFRFSTSETMLLRPQCPRGL